MNTSGNTILITGATNGIGRALAHQLHKIKNTVIVVGRDEHRLTEMDHQGMITFACDVSKLQELEKLSLFIQQRYPKLNVLINNAGIQYNYSFLDEVHLINRIEHEVAVNFLAPLRLTALLLPVLVTNKNASVVNVSSGLGLVPKKQAPVYCGTKGGLHIFSKSLRYQLDKVKVFELIPPLVDTDMTKGRGRGKISPDQVAAEFIHAFARNHFEVSVGKVKLLKLINRIAPTVADRIMKNG